MFEATISPGVIATGITPTGPAPGPTPTPTAPTFTPERGFTPGRGFTPTNGKPPPLAYTCANVDGKNTTCTGTGAADFVFKLLQSLINMANVQIGKSGSVFLPQRVVSITVDGRLDPRTLSAYMPVSRAIGGTLAIFDFTPDAKFLATNAIMIAQTIAQWLNITWVEGTALVPGHWDRLRAGQTSKLPVPPTQTQSPGRVTTTTPTTPTGPPLCPPGTVATSQGCLSTTAPSDQPQQPPQPQQPQPQPGRVDVGPTTQTSQQPQPQPQPQVVAPTSLVVSQPARQRYAGCIARFNKSRRVFSIYCPITAPSGFGIASEFRCLYGDCGLGADAAVTPPVPAGFVKAAETAALPGQGETPAGEESDKFFRANNPLMWLTFVGVAAAVSGGGYMIYRRRKHA